VCSPPKPCEDAVSIVSFARTAPLLTVSRPAIPLAPDAVASIAAQPAVRDDRDPPLVSGQGVSLVRKIRNSVKWNVFDRQGLTDGVVKLTGLFCLDGQRPL
jgi:uncharacterized NAD(P)/FAD-binding protein YdhS